MSNYPPRLQKKYKQEADRIKALPRAEMLAELGRAEIFVIESQWLDMGTMESRCGFAPLIGGCRMPEPELLELVPGSDNPNARRWRLFESQTDAIVAAAAVQQRIRLMAAEEGGQGE